MPNNDNTFPPELAGRRSELLAGIVAEGTRRRRRRRGLTVVGVLTPVAVLAAIILSLVNHATPAKVDVVSPDSIGVCQGGTAPVGTDARLGAGFRFGWLPAGWNPISGAVPPESTEAGPGGQAVNGEPLIVANYKIDPTPLRAVAGFNGTVLGHAAIVYLPAAPLNQDQSVTWEPVPGVVATVSANNIRFSETDLLRLADTVQFIPGVTPPAVGDLGHLIPRAQARAAAQDQFSDPNQPDVTASETWLVTPAELRAAHILYAPEGPDAQPGALNPYYQTADPVTPIWVIVTYTDATHWDLTEVDASNNVAEAGTSTGLADLALPPSVTTLVDHATRGACPDPTSVHPANPPTTHLTPECALAQLAASVLENPAIINRRPQVDIAVRNIGAKPCAVQGAPVLTYLNEKTDQQILGTEHQIGPSSNGPPNPVVILSPHHTPIPAGISDPTNLPAGSGWFSVTANPAATKCAATITRKVLYTLPFDATMPVHFNVIPTANAVANPPVSVDNCGTFFTNPFQTP